jgi:hypothetical protein
MDQARMNKWSAFCFFLPSSLALAYFVFYLATFSPAPVGRQPLARNAPSPVAPASPERVILSRGTPQTVGKVRLTYEGMKADALVIDVTIPDLDPEYAYHLNIPTETARQGFRIAEHHYRLISAGRSRLKIARTKG